MNTFFLKSLLIEYEDYNHFLKQICDRSREHNHAIYCVNFLHLMNGDIPEKEKRNLRVYTHSIDGIKGSRVFLWNLMSSRQYQFSNDITRWFANESIMILNGIPLLSYRKSSYYREDDDLIKRANYYHGFGVDEICDGLDKDHKRFAENLRKDTCCMATCWDIQKHIRAWRRDLLNIDISFAAERIVQDVCALRQVLEQYPTSLDQYKLCIIQSNFTNLNEVIDDFPSGMVVVQSDPNSPSVIKIQYPQDIIDKISVLRQTADSAIQTSTGREKFNIENALKREIEDLLKQNAHKISIPIIGEHLNPLSLTGKDDTSIRFTFILHNL